MGDRITINPGSLQRVTLDAPPRDRVGLTLPPAIQVTLAEVATTSDVGRLPTGGQTGQALVKTSNADYAVAWQQVGMTVEEVRDAVNAFLTAGTNVTLVHDDENDTLTIAANGVGGLDAEAARDTIALFLRAAGSSGLTLTHDDPGDRLTIAYTQPEGSITAAMLNADNDAKKTSFREAIGVVDTKQWGAPVEATISRNMVTGNDYNTAIPVPSDGLLRLHAFSGDHGTSNPERILDWQQPSVVLPARAVRLSTRSKPAAIFYPQSEKNQGRIVASTKGILFFRGAGNLLAYALWFPKSTLLNNNKHFGRLSVALEHLDNGAFPVSAGAPADDDPPPPDEVAEGNDPQFHFEALRTELRDQVNKNADGAWVHTWPTRTLTVAREGADWVSTLRNRADPAAVLAIRRAVRLATGWRFDYSPPPSE